MPNLIIKFGEVIFKLLFVPILIICALLLFFVGIFPMLLYRKMIIILQPFCRPDLATMLQPTSAIWKAGTFGSASGNFMFTAKVQGKLSFSVLVEKIKQVFLQENEEKQFLYPEFRMNLVQWYGFWFWKDIKNFEFENYILRDTIPNSQVLGSYELEFLKEEFKEATSPWKITCLELESEEPEPCWYLLFKNHHALSDGFGIFNVFMQLTENFENTGIIKKKNNVMGYLSRMWTNLTMTILIPLYIADNIFESLIQGQTNNNFEWNLKYEDANLDRIIAKSNLISYATLKRISTENSANFSTVLFALGTAGIRNTLKKFNNTIPDSINFLLPIPSPNRPNGLRNHFMLTNVTLPIGLDNSKERLKMCQLNLDKNQSLVFSYLQFIVQHILGCCPRNWLIPTLVQMEPVQITSFPGPKRKINLFSGSSILDLHFNMHWNGIATLLLCILSYNQGIRIVANADKSIFPTEESLKDLLDEMESEIICLQ